jgi:hypothetical protein
MKASLLERLIPKKIRLTRLKNNILKFYDQQDGDKISNCEKTVLDYLKTNGLAVFPYEFTKKYDPSSIEILTDPQLDLYYAMWEGKRLYFKNASNKKSAQKYFNSLLLEQDLDSPHRYLTDSFSVKEGSVVADVGAAEGNFSLSVIEKVVHTYIFEPDTAWVKALQATFAPWAHKVTIVQKLVGEQTTGPYTTLDDYFRDKTKPDFIKADVEGFEISLLKGAKEIIEKSGNMKAAICTYHRQEDAENIQSLLHQYGFTTAFSEGYMIFHYGRENIVRPPYLRKAVIRAVKSN